MVGVVSRALVLFGSVVIGLLMTSGPAAAAAASPTSGSTIITAVVEPVRYVLVDDGNSIKQITSNTPSSVAPKVYRDSYQSAPIALSPGISRQYAAIMAHANTRKYGVIYSRPQPAIKQPGIIADWLKKTL